MEKLKYFRDSGAEGVCFDVAQGHDARLYKAIALAKKLDYDGIAGNVCTEQGYIDLVNSGADAVKVGIGPGAACTTRIVTGFGVPQMSALLDIRQASLRYKVPYIADGGIRNSGDAVKALAAGASSVMVGKRFAQCSESAGKKRLDRAGLGPGYEVNFRGQASSQFQTEFFGNVRTGTISEGIDMWAPVLSTAEEYITEFCAGIRSGLTYGGSMDIVEFQKKAVIHEMIYRVGPGYASESGTRS
jgi:IMP dehydrogenase